MWKPTAFRTEASFSSDPDCFFGSAPETAAANSKTLANNGTALFTRVIFAPKVLLRTRGGRGPGSSPAHGAPLLLTKFWWCECERSGTTVVHERNTVIRPNRGLSRGRGEVELFRRSHSAEGASLHGEPWSNAP